MHYIHTVNRTKGFTLIELMVSLAIFTIVITVSIGTLLALIDANRKSQSLKSAMNNLNFVLDNITRSMRTGDSYYCGEGGSKGNTMDCANPPGGTVFSFTDDTDRFVEYKLTGTSVTRRVEAGNALPLTAPEIDITELRFYVSGSEPRSVSGESNQPKVTISIRGLAGSQVSTQTEFHIQTTVTQRILDEY